MNAMNFALHAQRRVFAGLKAMTRLMAPSAPRATAQHIATVPMLRTRSVGAAPFVLQKRILAACPAVAARPLRVLRVMEPGQQRTCVGRMVISGRMADVCAELDRLAAREAAMS